MKTRALFFTAPGVDELREIVLPAPDAGELLLETQYSAVSPGTEMRTLSGLQVGVPPFPVVPGYSQVGRVIARGADTTVAEGTLVFCAGSQRLPVGAAWGGHTAHSITSETRVFPVPDGVAAEEAVFAKLAAICVRGARMSKPQFHESVVVVGLGPIGHIAARVHTVSGARVIGVDTVTERTDALRHAGIESLVAAPDGIAAAVRVLLPHGADIIVDATGASGAAKEAVKMARVVSWSDVQEPATRYLVQGSYPDSVTLPYDPFFRGEITVLFARDQRPADIRTVLDLLLRRKLSLVGIAGAPVPVEDAPRIYAELTARKPELLTAVFRW